VGDEMRSRPKAKHNSIRARRQHFGFEIGLHDRHKKSMWMRGGKYTGFRPLSRMWDRVGKVLLETGSPVSWFAQRHYKRPMSLAARNEGSTTSGYVIVLQGTAGVLLWPCSHFICIFGGSGGSSMFGRMRPVPGSDFLDCL
jgi:hypothetical protein